MKEYLCFPFILLQTSLGADESYYLGALSVLVLLAVPIMVAHVLTAWGQWNRRHLPASPMTSSGFLSTLCCLPCPHFMLLLTAEPELFRRWTLLHHIQSSQACLFDSNTRVFGRQPQQQGWHIIGTGKKVLCTRLAQSQVSLSLALTLLMHAGTLLSPCTKAASCLPASARLHKLPCPAVLHYPSSASESVFLLSLSAPGGADRAEPLLFSMAAVSTPSAPVSLLN